MNKTFAFIGLFSILSLNISGQVGTISGRLIDQETMEPLPGISVSVLGSKDYRTDKDGFFLIKRVKPKPTELFVSGGFESDTNKEYFDLKIKNINLNRLNFKLELGDIKMVEYPKKSEEFPLYNRSGFKYPYSLAKDEGGDIIERLLVIDFQKSLVMPNIVNNRYPGGTRELRVFFANNLRYPEIDAERSIVGLSVVACTINPDGSIHSIEIINPISPTIDNEIKRLLNLTGNKWTSIEQDTLETFYAQIHFALDNPKHSRNSITAENVLAEVIVFAMGTTINSIGSNKRPTLYESERDGSLSARANSDEQVTLGLSEALTNKDWKGAQAFLNEAIVRNPYVPDLYQLRIMVNTKLGYKELVMEDVNKVSNFMNNMSLQQIVDEQ